MSDQKEVLTQATPFFLSILWFFRWYFNSVEETYFYILLKCLPMISLCLFALLEALKKNVYAKKIFIALIFSMIGDVVLIFKNETCFMLGMLSFAIAHLIYIKAFGLSPLKPSNAVFVYSFSIPIVIACFMYIEVFILKILVPVYTFIILAMVWRAMSRVPFGKPTHPAYYPRLFSFIGALLFVASDTLLSFSMFISKFPYQYFLILVTYFFAQFFITLSTIEKTENHSKPKSKKN